MSYRLCFQNNVEFRIADAEKHPIVFLKKKNSVVAKTKSASLTLSPLARARIDRKFNVALP